MRQLKRIDSRELPPKAYVDSVLLEFGRGTALSKADEEAARELKGAGGGRRTSVAGRDVDAMDGVSAEENAVLEAMKRKAFERCLKKPTIVSPHLVDDLEKSLQRQVLDGLALAKKAGCLITGFDTIDRALREKGRKWTLLWHAEDAAEDGCKKLDRVLNAIHPQASIVKRLPSEVISAVLGHSLIMHLCVEEKPGAKTLQDRLRHWLRYTTQDHSQSATT
jgi:hypothetical protein